MAFFFVSMKAEKVNCLLVIQLLTCVCFGLHFSRERRRQLQGVVSVLRPSFAFSRSLFLLFHLLNSTIKCIQQIYTTAHQCNFRELRLHVTYGCPQSDVTKAGYFEGGGTGEYISLIPTFWANFSLLPKRLPQIFSFLPTSLGAFLPPPYSVPPPLLCCQNFNFQLKP